MTLYCCTHNALADIELTHVSQSITQLDAHRANAIYFHRMTNRCNSNTMNNVMIKRVPALSMHDFN